MAWNALPDSIRDTALSTCSFRRHLKTLLLVLAHQRIRGFAFMRCINPRLILILILISWSSAFYRFSFIGLSLATRLLTVSNMCTLPLWAWLCKLSPEVQALPIWPTFLYSPGGRLWCLHLSRCWRNSIRSLSNGPIAGLFSTSPYCRLWCMWLIEWSTEECRRWTGWVFVSVWWGHFRSGKRSGGGSSNSVSAVVVSAPELLLLPWCTVW